MALLVAPTSDAQPIPPQADRVLAADTLRAIGTPDVWTTQYFEVGDNLWIEVGDPYGGRVRVPALFFITASSDLVAFAEGETARSVFLVPRMVTAVAALVSLIGLVTIVVFPFLVYRRLLRRERERRNHLDGIRHQLADGREAERLRLARDLHDGPIQDLHALRMRLSMLARVPSMTGGSGDGADDVLDEVVEEIQRVIRGLRGVSEDLRPPALGPFGLAAALRAFAERFQQHHPGIAVDLDLDDDGQALPEKVRLALFRIAQEAMNNAAKHGAPSRIGVELRLESEQVRLVITDDGRGYEVPSNFRLLGQDGHYGLLGMAERTDSIGAELLIESHPHTEGGPTRVQVLVPWNVPRRSASPTAPSA